MSLKRVIDRTGVLATPEKLAQALASLGVQRGDTVLVHVAMSAIGFVPGGAAGVLAALFEALGPDGTLVMPTQTADLIDPALWIDPALPPAWRQPARDALPAYDPLRSPSFGMGAVAELLRSWPGSQRSRHPSASFSANGPAATPILEPHLPDDPFGEHSPLARLYERDASIVLIGAPWQSCTAFHLAERRAQPWLEAEPIGTPMIVDGARRWVEWLDYPQDTATFAEPGEMLERSGAVRHAEIGAATGRLVRLRSAVDMAIPLFQRRVWS